MSPIQSEPPKVPCIIRCGGTVEGVLHMWSNFDPMLRRPVGICSRCGHIQLARPFQSGEYETLNERFFRQSYHPESEVRRQATRNKKTDATLNRLKTASGFRDGKLLDAGAGEGWSGRIAEHLGLAYHVVEPQRDLARRLERRGAKIAAEHLEDLLPGWHGRFSVIILRHTLEHLTDPVGALCILAQCLAPDGLIYVAVPNFSRARPKEGFKTDYLRPVHISYFTPNKLEWCLKSAGLHAAEMNDENEVWTIARKGESACILRDERMQNRNRIRHLGRKWLWRDMLRMAKMTLRRFGG